MLHTGYGRIDGLQFNVVFKRREMFVQERPYSRNAHHLKTDSRQTYRYKRTNHTTPFTYTRKQLTSKTCQLNGVHLHLRYEQCSTVRQTIIIIQIENESLDAVIPVLRLVPVHCPVVVWDQPSDSPDHQPCALQHLLFYPATSELRLINAPTAIPWQKNQKHALNPAVVNAWFKAAILSPHAQPCVEDS